jgi:hypothetical protein
MRLLSLLEDERKSGAIWYVLFRQSPYSSDPLRAPRSLRLQFLSRKLLGALVFGHTG